MRHYVYRIEIPNTDFFYIGKRSCKGDPQTDPYLGSGTEVMKYQYRLKIILEECDSSSEAYSREKELIGDQWKTNPNCLNRRPGGKGAPLGSDHHWFGKPSAYNKSGKDHHAFGKSRPDDVCEKISIGQQSRTPDTYLRGEDHPGFGKSRPVKVCEKISKKHTGKKRGPHSADHASKISQALMAYTRPQVTCEWCNKTMDVNNATRYHGENCKLFPK